MAGFLTRLEKRHVKGKSAAGDLIIDRSIGAHQPNAPRQPTTIHTTDSDVGSPDALLAELKADAEKNRKNPTQSAVKQPHREAPVTRVRIVQSDRSSSKKKTDIFDESLPWWLTDPVVSSPQVDALVPASRLALNDLITENIGQGELAEAIQRAVSIAADRLSAEIRFSAKDIQDSVLELTSLLLGKGPLQALYDDPAVTDIFLDGHKSIKCIRRGQALETPFRFRSPAEYEAYITAMLQGVDRVLNHSSPIVDCVLNDKTRSRVSAVHSSLLDGDENGVVVRVPRLQQVSFYDLLRSKTLPATLAAWLAEVVASGEANILVVGPTGSGKTTLTTALLSAVGSEERICTIEDVPEIFVPTIHLEKLVSRPENAQGEGAIGMEKLLRAALRRAPHRIIVGEIRDREGPLFLKALETGHAGSVATIHADSCKDGLWRLLDVVAAYEVAPQESIQRRIARSLHIAISLRKINGRPCVTEVTEIHSPIGGEFIVKPIVTFDGERDGKRQWRITSTRSIWMDKIARRGVLLQPGQGLLPAESRDDRGGNP